MKRELTLRIGNEDVTVYAAREGGAVTVQRGDEQYTFEIVDERIVGAMTGAGGAAATAAAVAIASAMGGSAGSAPAPAQTPAAAAPAPAAAAPAPSSGGTSAAAGGGAVPSPMTGVVEKVIAREGAQVQEGEQIMVLEAMKMYIDVHAPSAGTVSGIQVKTGDNVKEGQTLMTIT